MRAVHNIAMDHKICNKDPHYLRQQLPNQCHHISFQARYRPTNNNNLQLRLRHHRRSLARTVVTHRAIT
jgi:hypothetical protein